MGASSGSKKVQGFYDQAGGIYDTMSSDLLTNPLYTQGKQLSQNFMSDPFTYSPEFQQNMLGSMYDQAQGSYKSSLEAILEQVGAAGGLNSGMTRGELQRMSMGLGQDRANATRQVMSQARESRSGDINNALSLLNNMLTIQNTPKMAKANMLTGAASNPIWAQTSPLTSLVGAVAQAGLGMATGGVSTAASAGAGAAKGASKASAGILGLPSNPYPVGPSPYIF